MSGPTLWQSIQPYLDPSTGLLMARDGGKDNLVLLSCYLLRELEAASDQGNALLLRMRIDIYLVACRIDTGLFKREPHNVGETSLDNMTAIIWFDTGYAKSVHARWKDASACFRNSDPAWRGHFSKDWFGRWALVGYTAYLKAGCGMAPNIFERNLWSAATRAQPLFAKGASDPLLQSLQNDRMRAHCPWTVSVWERRYKLSQLYAEYFHDNGTPDPAYPLAVAARERGV
jgi:hypothetical protein